MSHSRHPQAPEISHAGILDFAARLGIDPKKIVRVEPGQAGTVNIKDLNRLGPAHKLQIDLPNGRSIEPAETLRICAQTPDGEFVGLVATRSTESSGQNLSVERRYFGTKISPIGVGAQEGPKAIHLKPISPATTKGEVTQASTVLASGEHWDLRVTLEQSPDNPEDVQATLMYGVTPGTTPPEIPLFFDTSDEKPPRRAIMPEEWAVSKSAYLEARGFSVPAAVGTIAMPHLHPGQ